MSTGTITPIVPTTTGYAGTYATGYISAYSLSASAAVPEFTQEIYPELFKNYGSGFMFLDFLRMAKRAGTINSRRLTAFQDTFDERPLTTSGNINTNSAGATIYFKADSGDYNSSGNTYVRPNDKLLIPREYITISGSQPNYDVEYFVDAMTTDGSTVGGLVSGTGANTVYTCKPLSHLSLVAVQIPSGTKFPVVSNAFAPGSGPVTGVIRNRLQYDFWTQISREGCNIEGGANAYRTVINGQERLWDRSLWDTERRLERIKDSAIMFSQLNTNTGLLKTSQADGLTKAVLSTQGVIPRIDAYGMDFPITNAGSFEFGDFDKIRDLLEAKGVVSGDLTFGAATELYTDVENCPFAWIDAGSSPGTDLHTEMGKFGIPFRRFTKSSYNITLAEISSFTRATGAGVLPSMKKEGLIIPNTYASVSAETGYGNRQKLTLPNIYLYHLEGRELLVQPRAGINELGIPNSSGYDSANMDMLTEYMVFQMDNDKMIHVFEEAAS